MTRAFLAVAGIGLLACEDPARPVPVTSGDDLTPPVVRFVAPSQDTTYKAASDVVLYLRFADPSGIDSVLASVSGGLNYSYDPVAAPPLDTVLDVGFWIPIHERQSSSIRFVVSAVDGRGNRSADHVLNLVVH